MTFASRTFTLLCILSSVPGSTIAGGLGADSKGNAVSVSSSVSVELMASFQNWADFHGKEYDSYEEKIQRLQIWLDNDGTYIHPVHGMMNERTDMDVRTICLTVWLLFYYFTNHCMHCTW
jgi:hypothetical protein